MKTNKADSPDFQYIDCVSGIQHLFDFKNGKDEFLKYDDVIESTDRFKSCFGLGSEPSRCGRRVISTKVFLQNVHDATMERKDKTIYVYLSKIIEATLKAVWDNCAIGQGDYYLPKEPLSPLDDFLLNPDQYNATSVANTIDNLINRSSNSVQKILSVAIVGFDPERSLGKVLEWCVENNPPKEKLERAIELMASGWIRAKMMELVEIEDKRTGAK